MMYLVRYSYVGPKSSLRSSALVLDAKDTGDAHTKAEKQLKAEGVEARIGKVSPWSPKVP